MSIIDNIKSLLPAKKPKAFEHLNTVNMEKFFHDHAGDMKECEYFYDCVNISYYELAKRANWHNSISLANEPKEKWKVYLPDYTAKNILKSIVDYTNGDDIGHTLVALKSCLDVIMKKQEVEPWVVYHELANLKKYKYDFDGNPLPEQRAMITESMRYMEKNGFLPDESKLRAYLVAYNNEAGWDQPLREGETREERQAGIDKWIENDVQAVMNFAVLDNVQRNEILGKMVKIRQEANTSGVNTDNKNTL